VGVWLISLEVIALTTYLGNWALKAPIATSKFLLDFHLLLLKTIGASSLRPLPFQVHLKSTQEFLLSWATTCVPPFKQLVEKKTDHLKKNILERLHDHSFTSILFYLPFDSHQSCLKLCVGPSASTWLLVH